MKRAVPGFIVRALTRQPVLLADWLALYNRMRRLRHDARTLVAALLAAAVAVSLFVVGAVRYRVVLTDASLYVASHALWAGTLTALYFSMQVSRWRIQAEQRHALSWLAVASPNPGAPQAVLLWRTFMPLLVQLLITVCCLMAIGLWSVPVNQRWFLMGWLLLGSVAGAVVGWWRGGRRVAARGRLEDSRYVRRARARSSAARPSLAALSQLPVMRALAWFRPENARLFVLVVIATMPAGTSALSGACALLVAFLITYAGALGRAVPQTATEAAQWLRATPIRFLVFAWPILRRALLHQLIVSSIIAVLLMQLGASLSGVSYLVLLWMSLVLMSGCVWLQGCFHSERPLLKTVASVATALGVEQLARGVGIGGAVLWTCWNLRARPS